MRWRIIFTTNDLAIKSEALKALTTLRASFFIFGKFIISALRNTPISQINILINLPTEIENTVLIIAFGQFSP